MRRITCFLCALVAGTAQAAVTTVETRIAPLDNGYRVEHRLTGISDGAHVPLPAGALDLAIDWAGPSSQLDYRAGWDEAPPAHLLPYVEVGPIVALEGDGAQALIRYTVPVAAGEALAEPLGTARMERGRATVAIAIDLPSTAIAYSPTHELSHGRALGTPDRPLPDTPLLLLPLNPTEGELAVGSLCVAPEDGDDGYVLVAITGRAKEQREPVEIAFALDVSGSMDGEKLAQAKRALEDAQNRLGAADSVELISFNHEVVHHQTKGELNLPRVLSTLSAGGNTNLAGAMMRPAESKMAVDTVVVLTDGLPTTGITEESAIRTAVVNAYAGSEVSLHAIGVGNDVNAPLLDAVSAANHGAVSYVKPGEDVRAAVGSLLARIGRPAARGLGLTVAGKALSHPVPAMDELGDLFDGEVTVLVARYQEAGPATLRLAESRSGGRVERLSTDISLASESPDSHAVIKRLWAGKRVAQIEYAARIDNRALAQEELAEVNDLNFRNGVGNNTNLQQLKELKSGASVLESLGSYNESVGAFGSRSGGGAVAKSKDWALSYKKGIQRAQVLDDEGQEVQLDQYWYQGTTSNAVRQGQKWVDGEILAERARQAANGEVVEQDLSNTRIVDRESDEYDAVLRKAIDLKKEALLSLDGEVELQLEDETVIVK